MKKVSAINDKKMILGKLILQMSDYLQDELFNKNSPGYLQLNDKEKEKMWEKKLLLMKAINDIIKIYNDGDDIFKL
jgi:hypothetical protein